MDAAALLLESFGRLEGIARRAVDGLDIDALTWRPDDEANPIAWLGWHAARVQDHHVAELAGREQVWDVQWAPRFGLEPGDRGTGFGDGPSGVARVQPASGKVLLDYLEAVVARTCEHLDRLDAEVLGRVVDGSWDPPVTHGARLVSVLGDDLQHLGQSAYVRGLWEHSPD